MTSPTPGRRGRVYLTRDEVAANRRLDADIKRGVKCAACARPFTATRLRDRGATGLVATARGTRSDLTEV